MHSQGYPVAAGRCVATYEEHEHPSAACSSWRCPKNPSSRLCSCPTRVILCVGVFCACGVRNRKGPATTHAGPHGRRSSTRRHRATARPRCRLTCTRSGSSFARSRSFTNKPEVRRAARLSSCIKRQSHQGSRWAEAQAARPNLARRSAPQCCVSLFNDSKHKDGH